MTLLELVQSAALHLIQSKYRAHDQKRKKFDDHDYQCSLQTII